MADANAADTTVTDEVPLPDSLADTELNGLNPADDSTESEQVEPGQEETPPEQPEEPANPEDPPANPETPEEKPETNPEQTEQKPEVDPEAEQRQRNAEMAARRVAAKQAQNYVNNQRQAIRQYEAENDMSTVEEQVKVMQAQQYVDTVERNRSGLVNDNVQAQATIPLFNPNAPEFNQALYTRALQRFNDTYVVTDPETNEVLGAQDRNGNNVSLFQYLQQEAADYGDLIGTTQGTAQRQAQQAEAKMRAKAVNPQGAGKSSSSGDTIDELFDKVKDIPLV